MPPPPSVTYQRLREYIAKRLHQGISATWADSLDLFRRWYHMEGFE